MTSTRVGIAGATGYGGQELLRLAARHPAADITVAMASGTSDTTRALAALTGLWSGEIAPFSIDRLVAETDVVFLALPEQASAAALPALAAHGKRVFDLSGAFRLRDEGDRTRWYPDSPPLDPPAVYGLTERRREALRDARVVACPGCYPTTALLAIDPLAEAGVLDGDIIIDAKSGISGAGKRPSEKTHFSERHGSIAAYGVLGHRHHAEIEQELGRAITFVPHLVPLDRGILATIYARVRPGTSDAAIADIFADAYRHAPFVRVRGNDLPEIKHVAYTNFCDIGWRLDPETGRLILVACLDNLIKGAAGQAIQNFNVAHGLDERTGLI